MNDTPSSSSSTYLESIGGDTEEILNVRGEVAKRRTWLAALVEKVGHVLSHPAFFLILLAGHLAWVLLNLPIYPWWEPWDPYPFTFLATIASVEAPFIALMVLMHQQREQHISELRGETHLQVSLHVEREVSKTLQLLERLDRSASGDDMLEGEAERDVQQERERLQRLQEELDPQRMMEEVRRDLREVSDSDSPTTP